MGEPTKANNKPSTPKEGKANNNNYTPYRKAYSKAKSILAKKHKVEFKEILKDILKK